MPVVAVAAAAITVATVPGIIAAGTLTVLGAMTAIGAVTAAVGAVTKSKTLMMIGAGIGLVGGIGTLAFGSDALGTVDELFGAASGSSSGAAGAAGAAGDAISTAAGTNANYLPGAVTSEALPAAAGAADITSATGAVANANPAGIINSSLAPAQGNVAGIVTGGDTASALGSSLSTGTNAASTAGTVLADGTLASGQSWSDALTAIGKSNAGPLSNAMNWAKDNQLLAYGILQSGGAFISGLTDPMSPAQVAALEAQAAANNAAAGVAQRRARNMAGGMPTATVTGRPAPVPGGIINNSSTRANPIVTGTINAPGATVTGAAA